MKKILVIDDDHVSARVIAASLIASHYRAETYYHVEPAWKRLQQFPEKYAVVIIDRILPEIDALGFLQRMKSRSLLKNIPVIVMTGEADELEKQEVMNAGAFTFVYKPLSKELLLLTVELALLNTRHSPKSRNPFPDRSRGQA